MNDRSLRQIVTGLGGKVNGIPRESGFDITAASEVMAILAMSRDLADLRARLGAITVAQTYDGEPVTAEELRAAGSMTVLLKEAIKPNLVQTLEGGPAFVHCGPFANIAHGNSSLVATRMGLKLADFVVTEGGFASDLGMEKFLDIVARTGKLVPSAIVLVATVRALEHHGDGDLVAGMANLERHLGIAKTFGLNAVVSINAFPTDTTEQLETVKKMALERGAWAAEVNYGFARGGAGAAALAETVAEAARRPSAFEPIYPLDLPIADKIEAIATKVYGADGIQLLPSAKKAAERYGRRASGACRSAWRRRTSPSRTTRNSRTRRPASRSRCATSAPTRARAGLSPSAVTCKRCPGLGSIPPRSISISGRTAARSVSSSWASAADPPIGGRYWNRVPEGRSQ